jgi:hypothetical protein
MACEYRPGILKKDESDTVAQNRESEDSCTSQHGWVEYASSSVLKYVHLTCLSRELLCSEL